MEKICEMEKMITCLLYEKLNGDISKIDAEEFGEVVDVLKDLAQYRYYHEVAHSMKKKHELSEEVKSRMYYNGQGIHTMEEIMAILDSFVDSESDKEMTKKKIAEYVVSL